MEQQAKRGRGRPVGTGKPIKPAGTQFVPMKVWVPPGMVREIDAQVSERGRSEWARRAFERQLADGG